MWKTYIGVPAFLDYNVPMNQRLLVFVILALAVGFSARAETQYPIVELGNCANQAACATYCDVVANQQACTAYAAANSLSTTATTTPPAVSTVAPGPGGCTTQAACQAYCDIAAHQVACTTFAGTSTTLTTSTGGPSSTTVATSTVSSADQKRSDAIVQFGGPDGACNDLVSCRVYCDDPTHELSCTKYSLEHDLLPKGQATQTITVLTTVGPQGCTGAACDEYCAIPGHELECIEYAKKKGLIDPKEATAQLDLIKSATVTVPTRSLEKPGRCKNRGECQSYCADDSHKNECDQYALDNGVTTQTIGDYQAIESAPPPTYVVPPVGPIQPVTPPATTTPSATDTPATTTPGTTGGTGGSTLASTTEASTTPTQGASLVDALAAITKYLFSR